MKTLTDERYFQLERNPLLELTSEELLQGYHFCPDWDGLLIGVDMPEIQGCTCK